MDDLSKFKRKHEFECVCGSCKFDITDPPNVAEVKNLLVKITSHFPFRCNDCCQIDFWCYCVISVRENADVRNSSQSHDRYMGLSSCAQMVRLTFVLQSFCIYLNNLYASIFT